MALISEETIRRVRESNDIVDVIGNYLPLTQKGKNYFAVCPFHDDHSPSMSISKEKQIFRCFVCGATGNVISFVKDYERISFIEAVDILAKNAGLNVKIDKHENINPKYKEYYNIYNIALSFYKNNLNTKSGEKAREYLNRRKLTKETIDYFDIGLSLNDTLSKTLSKEYDPKILIDIGLTREGIRDIFTNRIMFTIKDNYGNPVGFSGRIYDGSSEAKYVNTKESVIFKKGTILYNFWRAKDEIRRKKEIIISEGQMEVIRLHTVGIDNAVALLGTSFTKEHLNIIKNIKASVILNLDQDEAGKTATIRIGDMLTNIGINPTVIIYSNYKDTDELIMNEGLEAFQKAYETRVSFIDFKLNYLKKNRDLKKAEDLSVYIKNAIDTINMIEDDILREVKIKWLSKEYDISEDLIRSKISTSSNKPKLPEVAKTNQKTKQKYDGNDKSEIRLLYLMLNNPNLITYYENHLGYMNNEKRRNLASSIVYYKEKNKIFEYADFICYTMENPELEETLKEVTEYPQSETYTDKEIEDYINNIKKMRVQKQINTLKEKLKNTIDIKEKEKLAKRIQNIKKEVVEW